MIDSWHNKIKDSTEVELRLWKDRENLMDGVKNENLAWTLLPEGPQETAIVEAAFPEVKFKNNDGQEVVVNFQQITSGIWPNVIEFADLDKIYTDQSLFGGTRVTIQHKVGKKVRRVKYNTKTFPGDKGLELAEAVNRYHLRCQSAQYQLKLKEMREFVAGR